MDISVNTGELKDKKDEEPAVTDIEAIKSPGYFKLFACSKYLFNNLETMYKRVCTESAKEKYWSKFHQIITNYNDWNYTPLCNLEIRETINKLVMEEEVIEEADNVTVHTFMVIPPRNES